VLRVSYPSYVTSSSLWWIYEPFFSSSTHWPLQPYKTCRFWLDNVKKNPAFRAEFRNFRDSGYVRSLKSRFSTVFAIPDDLVTIGERGNVVQNFCHSHRASVVSTITFHVVVVYGTRIRAWGDTYNGLRKFAILTSSFSGGQPATLQFCIFSIHIPQSTYYFYMITNNTPWSPIIGQCP
jgi:hypothetical protein